MIPVAAVEEPWRREAKLGRVILNGRTASIGLVALAILFGFAVAPFAQTGSAVPDTLPNTMIAPAGSSVSEAPIAPSAPSESAEKPRPVRRRAAMPRPAIAEKTMNSTTPDFAADKQALSNVVEPAKGHLRIISDSWAYSLPDKRSSQLEAMQTGKYVNVTGTTRYFLQVRLKSGKTGYVPYDAIDYLTPTDRIFRLTANATVLSAPNHASKKLAEVHLGHDVHVIGVALNYMKIRMRDGLEGFIPTSALE
jgi:hypothetical protein